MKHRRFLIAMIIAILFMMPTASIAEQARIQKEDGRVLFDIPAISSPERMKSYSAEYMKFDVEAIKNAFLGDTKFTENITPQSEENEYAMYNYASEQAKLDIVDQISVSYETNHSIYISQLLSSLEVYPENELGFMSRQAAAELCMDMVKSLFGECMVDKVYSLDADLLRSISDAEREELQEWADIGKEIWLKDDWSQADECYYLKLKPMIDGVAYTSESYVDQASDASYNGCTIEAIVTQNGIESFTLYNIPQIIETHEEQAILSQDAAMKIYADSVNNILGDSKKTIDGMMLELMPVYEPGYNFWERFRVIPAWILEQKVVAAGPEGEIVGHRNILIDAITGEMLG